MFEFRPLAIPAVVEITSRRSSDERGFFCETYHRSRFAEAGIDADWVQDNQSLSVRKFTLRGLHFQTAPFAQDKLVRVLRGSVFDVCVDIRRGSPSFGAWVGLVVSAERVNQVLVPKGFAHGFLTLEENTEVFYKVSAVYAPSHDRALRWDDPSIGIDWPLGGFAPVLSEKDRAAPGLRDADLGAVEEAGMEREV